jgi:hypothetical protein
MVPPIPQPASPPKPILKSRKAASKTSVEETADQGQFF